jgi:DNA invertase Pin-like site-specific DNA recombinase
MKNICLYARVSTSKEQDVSSQINALRTHASKMGYRSVRESTEEVSGIHGRDGNPPLFNRAQK